MKNLFDFPVTERVYARSAEYGDLRLFMFGPRNESQESGQARPVILFLHGAGFSAGRVRPEQFQHHADYFAGKGMVAVCVEYRPEGIEGVYSPMQCIKHTKAAVGYVRAHAAELGMDPKRIAAAGASAGGYLALCTAMIEPSYIRCGELEVSCVPDALILFNGGVDAALLVEMFPELSTELMNASPIGKVRGDLPPSLFFHRTLDANIPYNTIEEFVDGMKGSGNNSRLVRFEGLGHGFFNYGNHENIPFRRTLLEIDEFLKNLGWLE